MLTEILIVVVLTVINGVLAMSELAVVSSRPARLKVLSDQGSKGAATAIRLAENPGRFLSTVQIGITLVGVLSGAFSGATLGARLSEWLGTQGLSNAVADALGVGTVVVLITYLSLIVGELVPKQIALRDAERVAARVAPTMALLAKVASPWSGCSTPRAGWCWRCSARRASRRRPSPRRRSAPSSRRPRPPACWSATSAR